jgi:hypothetical protein
VATDARVDIASTYSYGLGYAYALACQQATHLLQAGPRSGDEAHWSTWQMIGKAEGNPIEHCSATVWPHHQQALLRCQVF